MARLHPGAVLGVVKELRAAAADERPLVVGGARMLAGTLAAELRRGGDARAVREGDPHGAACYVHVLAGDPSEADLRTLRAARRDKVPVVVVLADPDADHAAVPVPATDVVRVPAGEGFPVDEVAAAVAGRLGERATSLAARLPVLRPAICEQLISAFARRAGAIGAAVFVPGADMPVLTLNQLRLVLRIAAAHGVEIDQSRVPEVLAVIGGGFALRAAARQALGLVPVAGWAVKGAVAYGGTRAVGEAAVRYFAERAAGGAPASA